MVKVPRSLILITIDCLRADHVGFLGYDRPTTPFMDSLAADSTIFRNAVAAGSPTYYSFPAIMASRYPLALGRDVIGLAPEEPTLASALRQIGYATGAFVASNPYLSTRFGYDAGFDRFRDFLRDDAGIKNEVQDPDAPNRANRILADFCHRLGPAGALYDELYFQYCQRQSSTEASWDGLRRFPAADVIVGEALDWLATVNDNPFFLWLHFMDPHAPYYPKAEALEEMDRGALTAKRGRYLNSYWNRGDLSPTRLARHRKEVGDLYDAGIRWVDDHLARLAKALKGKKLWENCVFAVTADHGEEFLEHGGRNHPPSKLTEELIRVPLLLRDSAGKLPAVVEGPFSLLDLAPTLLQSVGAPMPSSFRGRSAWGEPGTRADKFAFAITESVAECTNPFKAANRGGSRLLSVRGSQYKLVVDFAGRKEMFFDLRIDPGEMKPLPRGESQAARRRLLTIARDHIAESRKRRDPVARLQAKLHDLRFELAAQASGGMAVG